VIRAPDLPRSHYKQCLEEELLHQSYAQHQQYVVLFGCLILGIFLTTVATIYCIVPSYVGDRGVAALLASDPPVMVLDELVGEDAVGAGVEVDFGSPHPHGGGFGGAGFAGSALNIGEN